MRQRQISVGVVGAGYIANFAHLPVLSRLREVRLTAICDEDASKAQAAAHRFSIPKAYSSLNEMLACEHLELVDICVPPRWHREILLKALEHGLNCLVEKPLTVTTADADIVVGLAKQRRVNVHTIFNYSFVPGVMKAQSLVKEGAVGQVTGISINHFVPLATRHLDPNHWCHSLPGDYFSELGPHLAMLLLQFLGRVSEVKSIVMKASSYPQIRLDELRIIARGEAGIGTITCSLNCPSRLLTVDIFGTEGALHVDGNYQAVVHYRPIVSSMDVLARGLAGVRDITARVRALASTSTCVLMGIYAAETYGHRYLIQRSVRSLLGQGEYPITIEQAREAVHLLEMAFQQL